MAGLGLALTAAVLGLGVATAAAVAEPTEPSTPPATETTETTETTEVPPPTETTEPPPASDPDEEQPPTEPVQEPETPADEAVPQSIQDVRMTATFDRSSYDTGEKMTITVTVTNTGAEEASVRTDFYSSAPDAVVVDWPNPFEGGGLYKLAAGGSRTHQVTGAVGNPAVSTGTLYGWVTNPQGETVRFTFTVPVNKTVGHAEGTVYTDRNDNGRFDAGEGQSGVTLNWVNVLHQETRIVVTTDAAGGFALDLPTGRWGVSGAGPDGLVVGWRLVTIDKSGVDGLLVRAVSPIRGLTVDLEFTKDTYARDEAVIVRVTLTNNGTVPLHGIIANCNRAGFSNELNGTGPGWGALAGDGVSVAPGSTVVILVTEPMPAAAFDYGYLVVACDFGYAGVDAETNPGDHDEAAVPGQVGDAEGVVVDAEVGIGGVRVVLVGGNGCPAGEDTTDRDGRFAIRQVPVGRYDLYVLPPAGWHTEYDNPTDTFVVGHYPSFVYVELEQGLMSAPTLPTCTNGGIATPPPAPRPQARTAPDKKLADTGASIAGPAVVGALALLTGAGVVLATRRRRSTD